MAAIFFRVDRQNSLATEDTIPIRTCAGVFVLDVSLDHLARCDRGWTRFPGRAILSSLVTQEFTLRSEPTGDPAERNTLVAHKGDIIHWERFSIDRTFVLVISVIHSPDANPMCSFGQTDSWSETFLASHRANEILAEINAVTKLANCMLDLPSSINSYCSSCFSSLPTVRLACHVLPSRLTLGFFHSVYHTSFRYIICSSLIIFWLREYRMFIGRSPKCSLTVQYSTV